jgi:hypothetical protein
MYKSSILSLGCIVGVLALWYSPQRELISVSRPYAPGRFPPIFPEKHSSWPCRRLAADRYRHATLVTNGGRYGYHRNETSSWGLKSLTYPNGPDSSLQMLITAVKIYIIIQLLGETAVSHRDLSNYVARRACWPGDKPTLDRST